jgi:16S rRNA (cytidine1402-2'-O)-methyltransferase
MKGTMYLIPTSLGDDAPVTILPEYNLGVIKKLTHFVVEDLRSARRFLKKVLPEINIDGLSFYILNEHSTESEIAILPKIMLEGNDLGLLSEAGLPCVADPGAILVGHAHEAGIKVVPLSGPSSIFLALMASGFNGQNFSFLGYLPIDKRERMMKIRELETAAGQSGQTQIFIEAPYRNRQMMDALLESLHPSTNLCIAVDLTLPGEYIRTLPVQIWKKSGYPDINKKPAVFLVGR